MDMDPTARYSEAAEETLRYLDRRSEEIFAEIRQWRGWPLVIDPAVPPEEFLGVVREIFFAVSLYQPDTTEAGFRMIGRLPKSEVKLLQVLTHHKADEAEHGVWAYEDYLALGGARNRPVGRPQTPATFAIAAVWWWMAESEDPFGYLGAEYLFEHLTEIVTKEVMEALDRRGVTHKGLRFIVEHATEDIKHGNLFRHLVRDTVTRYPASAEAMVRCFEHFAQVYPLPAWDEAFRRARG